MGRRKFDPAQIKLATELLDKLATGANLVGLATPTPADNRILAAIAAILRAPDMPKLVLGVLDDVDYATAANRAVSLGVAAGERL